MTSLVFITRHLKHKIDPILFMYMRCLSNKDKFERLQLYYLSNPFLTPAQAEDGLSFFEKIQHTYWMLRRFVYIWRLYKARKCINQQDFLMNELSSLSSRHKIQLLHDGTLYDFRLSDLLNIICKSLTNSENLNPKPKWPNNPYTGLAFTRAHLYATYLKLREMAICIPYYFHLFFKWELSISKFKFELFPLLKDDAIKNYLLDSSDEILLFDIIHMIKSLLDKERDICTDKMTQHKRKNIVQTLKPYLEKYLYGTLSNNRRKKNKCRRQAKKELTAFFEENPTFGRRIIKVKRNHR